MNCLYYNGSCRLSAGSTSLIIDDQELVSLLIENGVLFKKIQAVAVSRRTPHINRVIGFYKVIHPDGNEEYTLSAKQYISEHFAKKSYRSIYRQLTQKTHKGVKMVLLLKVKQTESQLEQYSAQPTPPQEQC